MDPEVEKSLRIALLRAEPPMRRRGRARGGAVVRHQRGLARTPPSPGEHDTYLWVRGADDVVDAVRRCWASLFTDRATCYRVEMGYDHRSVEMSVVVQKMVRPIAAGVAFTLEPRRTATARRSRSTRPGASARASCPGEVTPDNYLVDKVLYEISRRAVSDKEHEYRLTDHDTVEKVEVDPERADRAVPDGRRRSRPSPGSPGRAEQHYGSPAGHRVGGRLGPAGGRERHPAAGPARDGLEQEGRPPPGRGGHSRRLHDAASSRRSCRR